MTRRYNVANRPITKPLGNNYIPKYPEIRETLVASAGNIPNYLKRPELFSEITKGILELGRWDVACENVGVPKTTCKDWLINGKKQYDESIEQNLDDHSLLAQFYLEVTQAASLFMTKRLQKVYKLADSGDPEYKNFNLWIIENVDPERRFVKTSAINTKVDGKVEHVVSVRYANGNEWVTGVVQEQGSIVDTEFKQIESGPDLEIEDF